MRTQGYDVIANPENFGNNEEINRKLKQSPQSIYEKSDGSHPFCYRAFYDNGKQDIENFMTKLPDGAICQINCRWNDNNGFSENNEAYRGHTFIAQKENGVIVYKDPQTANLDVSSYFERMEKGYTSYIRIDDTKVSDEYIWYIARNKG